MAESMVLVGCKAPNGVVLNLDRYEPMAGGQVRRIVGKKSVTLNGWAHEFNKIDPAEGTGGYVLTSVPASFWEEWIASHADFPMIEDMTILGPAKDAVGQAREMFEVPKMFAPPSKDIAKAAFNARD